MRSDMEDMPIELRTPENIIDCFLDRGGEGERIVACLAEFELAVVKKSLLDELEQALEEACQWKGIAHETAINRDSARALLRDIETWAKQRCPCDNDEPKICPLCDADVSKDRCMAVDDTFPRALRARIEAMLEQKP